MRSVGYLYLIEKFGLSVCEVMSKSFLMERSRFSVVREGAMESRYYPIGRTSVEDSWQGNLIFALKNEGVNLEVLKAFFGKVGAKDIEEFVLCHPTGNVSRRVWFLYEYLTGVRLGLEDVKQGGYVKLVDEDVQVACPIGVAQRARRYRVINNLLGNRAFSPFVRATDLVKKYPASKLKELAGKLLEKYSPELLYRAVQYLYVKETRSSFAIERETPDQKRMDAFVGLLRTMDARQITKAELLDAQNRVVDARYAQRDWRADQVYVGETVTPEYEKIHFIAVQAKDLEDIMQGFFQMLERLLSSEMDVVILAAVMSFAFVFIHPFDDGNGRVHRYLMHAILARMKFIPQEGLIFPISAVLMKKPAVYDRMLETFSRRVMTRLKYVADANGEVTVQGESIDFYRYIDYTFIVEEFQRLIVETIRTEWRVELDYLVDYDVMRREMRKVVDLPEKKANQFILFVKNNHGKLSAAKRKFFQELTDDEIAALEKAIALPIRTDEK